VSWFYFQKKGNFALPFHLITFNGCTEKEEKRENAIYKTEREGRETCGTAAPGPHSSFLCIPPCEGWAEQKRGRKDYGNRESLRGKKRRQLPLPLSFFLREHSKRREKRKGGGARVELVKKKKERMRPDARLVISSFREPGEKKKKKREGTDYEVMDCEKGKGGGRQMGCVTVTCPSPLAARGAKEKRRKKKEAQATEKVTRKKESTAVRLGVHWSHDHEPRGKKKKEKKRGKGRISGFIETRAHHAVSRPASEKRRKTRRAPKKRGGKRQGHFCSLSPLPPAGTKKKRRGGPRRRARLWGKKKGESLCLIPSADVPGKKKKKKGCPGHKKKKREQGPGPFL